MLGLWRHAESAALSASALHGHCLTAYKRGLQGAGKFLAGNAFEAKKDGSTFGGSRQRSVVLDIGRNVMMADSTTTGEIACRQPQKAGNNEEPDLRLEPDLPSDGPDE